jgi:hypothetical protein
MEVTVQIPDDIATRLCAAGADLSRRALEGLALEEYKNGRLHQYRTSPLAGLWDTLET